MKTTRPNLPAPASPITTPRLLLRPLAPTDPEAMHAIRTQPEVMKWTTTGKTDADRSATRVWLSRFLPPNDDSTYNLAIEEHDRPGHAVGVVGLPVSEPPELGYMLGTEAWGRGYATEAVRAWLAVYWGLPRRVVEVEEGGPACERGTDGQGVVREVLRAQIEGSNAASRRVLEKCGFRWYAWEEVREHGGTVCLGDYCLERPMEG